MARQNLVLIKRFQSALKRLVEEQGATAESLAVISGCAASTVYKWLAGRQIPSRSKVKEICAHFNWDYEGLFSADILLDRVIHRDFLTLPAINARYLSLRQRAPFEAHIVAMVGAVTAFSYLVGKGMDIIFCVTQATRMVITMRHPKLARMVFIIAGSDTGLQIRLYDIEDQPLEDWRSLTAANLDACAETLRLYKDGQNG